jgi:nicotinate-nucleotide adenylyltransferase
MKNKTRIGIYSGSFDPIHIGHITFALQAINEAGLAKVYFLPERMPRDKHVHEHFGHRVAMVKRAIKPHPKLAILELDDRTFSVKRTLPKLNKMFNDSELVFLFGSDKIPGIANWPDVDRLLKSSDIIIGLREGTGVNQILGQTKDWPKTPVIIGSYWPAVVSTKIRQSLQNGEVANGLLKSVSSYIKQNWLYISLR